MKKFILAMIINTGLLLNGAQSISCPHIPEGLEGFKIKRENAFIWKSLKITVDNYTWKYNLGPVATDEKSRGVNWPLNRGGSYQYTIYNGMPACYYEFFDDELGRTYVQMLKLVTGKGHVRYDCETPIFPGSDDCNTNSFVQETQSGG